MAKVESREAKASHRRLLRDRVVLKCHWQTAPTQVGPRLRAHGTRMWNQVRYSRFWSITSSTPKGTKCLMDCPVFTRARTCDDESLNGQPPS